jgi:hypothetical protein
MKPLDRLSEYLGAVERRMRLLAVTRGAAVTAAAALTLTVLAVLMANHFSFSKGSVLGARVLLFIGLALALAAALIVPVIRLNRRRAARAAELRYPQFEERLLTFTEKMDRTRAIPFWNCWPTIRWRWPTRPSRETWPETRGLPAFLPPPWCAPWC